MSLWPVPTNEARAADEQAGYHLPFSVGRIVEVKSSGVVVVWLFSRHINGRWCVWDEHVAGPSKRKRTRNLRRDELDWACILRDQGGVLKIKFCADKTLTKMTIARLKGHPGLSMSEDAWKLLFRKGL